MKVISLAAAAGLLVASLPAETSHSAAERNRLFEEYLVRRGAEISKNSLSGVHSLADWKRIRPELHKQLLYMLGLDPMPAKTPLHARVTGAFERDLYRVEKVVFESSPGLYVTGDLYLPKGMPGPLPAVVYLSGHAPGPWGAKVQYQHHGIWLARHGYVCFLLDTIEFGEVPGLHHGLHNLGLWYWLSLGYTPAGPEVWNAIRALDYLETRKEVDAKKVAVTGISGGGAVTWYTAAVDERFQVAVPVCATWTAGRQAQLDSVQENCDCIYFHNTFLRDFPAMAALIAPRPLKILSARRDVMFPPAGYHEVYRKVRGIYDLYGAGSKVEEYDYEAPHSDIVPFRKEADEWVNRWLKRDNTPFDEGTIERETPETLRVLDRQPADSVNGRVHKIFIPTYHLKPWNTLESWKRRRTELTAQLKDKVFRAFPAEKVPFDAWKKKETGWTDRYADGYQVEFTSEEGVRITGRLFVPRGNKVSYPALIHVRGREDIVYAVDHDYLLGVFGTHAVLVLDPRGVDYPVNNYKMATFKRTAALEGATLESMQVWDILRATDYLTEGEHLKLSSISVYGRRQMGALGLYAAAIDDRITRVILDNPPYSHWQGPALLNILRLTDLPEAAALMAPREIVSLTALPPAYTYTSSVYALYGKMGPIREAGDLSEALKVWEQ
jgi:cephalosporin-C deacetylase-like acetyl esterase